MNWFASRLLALAGFCSVVAAASLVHVGAQTSVTMSHPDDQSGIALVMRLSVGASPLAQSALARLHASLAAPDRGSASVETVGAAPGRPAHRPSARSASAASGVRSLGRASKAPASISPGSASRSRTA